MNLTVYQQISIHFFKVNAVTNSSVLQVGASGTIQALSNLYNTGGHEIPAEEAEPLGADFQPVVPLAPPT